MSGAHSLLARALLGLVAAAATLALPRYRPAYMWTDRSFRQRYLLAFAALRLLLFALVFLVFHVLPRGDLPGIYIPEIQSRLAGRVPYRNYASSYAPLFPYLYAPIYRLAPTPLTLILFSIVAEILTAAVFLRFMPRVLSEQQARAAALLCLASPISLQFVTIDGQNNVLIGLAFGLALLWLAKRREALSGAALGMAIASVKFLPLLFTPVFPLFLRRRALAWTAGCAAVVLAIYGYFALVLGAPVLQAFQREGGLKSAGGLPFLVEAIAGRDLGSLGWDALLLMALGAVLAWAWQLSRRMEPGSRAAVVATTLLLPTLLFTVMAMAKKSWPTYTEMVLFPLGMAIALSTGRSAKGRPSRFGVCLFAGFNLISVTVHSVWASLLRQASAVQVHRLLLAGDRAAWLLLSLESALIAGYAALVWLCLGRARSPDHSQG